MDTMTLVNNRITAMNELNSRQDKTAKLLLWNDTPYELTRPDGKTKLDDAISITPNLPRVFAHGVISDLIGGKWQTVVEGNIPKKMPHIIESFVDDNLAQADELLLTRYGIPSLHGWLSNHVCARWAIGARWLSSVVDNDYKIDCLPVDMRWCPFEFGEDGLWWVCNILFKSKSFLQNKFPDAIITSTDGTDIEVRDFWDGEKNELWIDRKLVKTDKNSLGYPPFVIVIPPTGFMLRDRGYLKHEGEDILFLNAGLYEELARSLSLEQTSGYAGLYPAYEYETKNPDSKPAKPTPKIDETMKVPEGERHQPVPRGDLNKAGQTARVDIQDMLSQGAPLSPRQYNTPPSAVLLAGETEMVARLQNARKDALGIFRSQLARMMIDQFIKAGKGKSELLVGKRGRKVKYSVSQLGNPDDYTISYRLLVKSKRQEMANLAEFSAAYGRLPLKWNLTNILMVDDPDGIIKELELEEAKKADPAIALFEMAIRYAEQAKEVEDEKEADVLKLQSMMLTERCVAIIEQRRQPVTPELPEKAQTPQSEEKKPNVNLLASMTGQRGGL